MRLLRADVDETAVSAVSHADAVALPEQERREGVHGHRGIPVVLRDLGVGRADVDAGGVHQDVRFAEGCCCGIRGRTDAGAGAQIARNTGGPASFVHQRCNGLVDAFAAAGDDDDGGAGAGERRCDASADS